MSRPPALSREELVLINGLSSLTSCLSLGGSLFIISCYLLLPRLRKFSFTLVFMLSITDVFNQLFDLITPGADDMVAMEQGAAVTTTCLAQAVGDSFFELSSVFWTTAISFTLFLTVLRAQKVEGTPCTLLKFSAWCYGGPVVFTGAAGIAGAFGVSGSECWISDAKSEWRWISFFVPLWLCAAFNGFVYLRVMQLLRRTVRMAGPRDPIALSIRSMMSRLIWYPFILAALWLLPSVNAVVEASTGGGKVFVLVLLASMTASLQGFLNALVYGLSPGVRDALENTAAGRVVCGRVRACVHRAGTDVDAVDAAGNDPEAGDAGAGGSAAVGGTASSTEGKRTGLLSDADAGSSSSASQWQAVAAVAAPGALSISATPRPEESQQSPFSTPVI